MSLLVLKISSNALDDYNVNDAKDTIETGYPTPTMKALHINSTKEPPVPNHSYTDDQIGRFYEEEDDIHGRKQVSTLNMYVESFNQLNLSLMGSDLTIQMVNQAYEKILNEHIANIRNDITEEFNIEDKKRARDYLIGTLSKVKN